MTTYTWPTGSAWVPASAELRVVDNLQRVHESSLSGYVQTQSMPGARWGWAWDMAPQTSADRQALEAYLLRLSGREHRVPLWDHKHPRPRGNISMSGVTLGAGAAQFASTLTLAGCRAGPSLIPYGNFALDSDGNGVSDGWSVGSVGATGAVSFDRLASASGTFQRVFALSLGAGVDNRVTLTGVSAAVTPGSPYTMSVDVNSVGVGHGAYLVGVWRDGAGGYLGEFQSTHVLTGALYRMSATGTAPAGAATLVPQLFMYNGAADLRDLWVKNFLVEQGAVASAYPGFATLLAGDWLGVASGQLLRVVADATANDAGAMAVEVRHMLRTAVASGTAVTLDRPTALYVRTESGLAMPRMPGNAEPGMSLEFVEVFA